MTKQIDLDPVREQIAEIEESLLSPMPTPPVGTSVVWYDRALVREEGRIAALVTKVEGPGKVTLTVFRPQGMPDPTRRGCLHVSHPVHQERHNATSKNSGAWDYVNVTDAQDSHFDLHRKHLTDKKSQIEQKLQEAEQINKKYEEANKPKQTRKQPSKKTPDNTATEEALS